ncbi:hypothetical protein [Paraglaciecola sp. 20A4]|uniref:hypothetical protein n=1 Tax=Paraglaciecola sp. 20A4 TaxID=2687288 RepID=UPI001F0FA855|nr:hypothetical protein [Paraglaciecola sp. 20A4]
MTIECCKNELSLLTEKAKTLKTIPKTLIFLCLLLAAHAQAALVTNGNFQSCDFTGWANYTDGMNHTDPNADFAIINNAGACQGQINIDVASGASAFYANTLSTEMDFTSGSNAHLWLSFDWLFSGFDDGSSLADVFFVNFTNNLGDITGADASPGFLLGPTSTYGAGTYSVMLDNRFINQSGWFLDFNLEGGFTPDSFSSTLLIDNVTLRSIPTNVPVPPMLALILLGAAALFKRSKQSNRTI